jgi:prophage antirepressor-like protein
METTDIKVFSFDSFDDVRVFMNGDSPWWAAKDIAFILGYSDTEAMTRRIDAEDKESCTDNSSGQGRSITVINESGLYTAILSSQKQEAKKFKRWITETVLPSIRKNGGYLSATIDFSDPENLQKVFDAWKEERAKRIAAETRVSRLVHNNRTYTTGEIAKELGMRSAQELNETLHVMGVIYKDARGVWLLYSEYASRGFQNIKQREVNGATRYYAEWTGVGRDWLIGIFSKAVKA